MIRFVAIILLLTCCLSIKIFMLGGLLVNDNNPIYQKLIQESGKPTKPNCDQKWDTTECPRVAVITSGSQNSQAAYNEYNKGDSSQAAAGNFFKSLGMAVKHLSVNADNYKDTTNVFSNAGYPFYTLVYQADILYFDGGDAARHIRCWLNDDYQPNPMFSELKRKIENDQIIILTAGTGSSAMSKIMYGGGSSFGYLAFAASVGLAKNTITSGHWMVDPRNGTNCVQYTDNGAYMPGFGFLDFAVDTQFDLKGRLGRLVPGLSQLNIPLGIGIDQHTAIYYKDGVGTVYGQKSVFVADISETLKTQSDYFHLKNVKLHLLSSGDVFNFKTRKMTTSRPPITPFISGFSDSNDILSNYECTRLITRLLDQQGPENFGKAPVPKDKGYPSQTPEFNLLFYKDSETKGYKSGSVYSAENIKVDYSAKTRN